MTSPFARRCRLPTQMDRSSPTASGSTSSNNSISGGDNRPKSSAEIMDSSLHNPLISVTEKCRICGEAAAKHVHYGAMTCFSCRAFFRRSIQNGHPKNYTCRKGGKCIVTLKTRKNCQKCRFDKCLAAGMKTSWVLTDDERHRRFRKHREKTSTKRRYSDEPNYQTYGYGPDELDRSPDGLQIAEVDDDEEEEQDQPIDFSHQSNRMPPLQPLFFKPLTLQPPVPEQVVSTPELPEDLDHLPFLQTMNSRITEVSRDEVNSQHRKHDKAIQTHYCTFYRWL